MTAPTPAMKQYEAGAGERSYEARRRFAETITRDDLVKWLLSDSFALPVQRAAMWLDADPLNPSASLEVYKELWAAHRRNANWSRLAPRREIRKAITAVAKIHGEQKESTGAEVGYAGLFETINQAAE